MAKCKILLIFAPAKGKVMPGELGEGTIAPLGLIYLGTYLKNKLADAIEIKLYDGTIGGFDATLKIIQEFQSDILGVTYYSPVAFGAYDIIKAVKEYDPGIFTIVGGPHATPMYEEAFNNCAVDAAVLGEGEETLLALVKKFIDSNGNIRQHLGEINGLVYKVGQKLIKNTPQSYIADLDTIPFPDWDLLPLKNYKGWYLKKGKSEAPMLFSRGCPYACTFCSNAVWKICQPFVRVRSPKNIADEIESLMQKYGVDEIYDCADEFNNNIANAIAVCEEIKRRKLKVYWKTQLRANPLPENLVKAMAEAGCWYVNLGIESANAETLAGVGKGITVLQVENALKLLKKYGIKVQGLFMYYNVWEDQNGNLKFEDTAQSLKNYKFAKKLIKQRLIDYFGWSVTTPHPGSKLYGIALRHNLIKPEFINHWDQWLKSDRFVMKLPGVTVLDQVRLKLMGDWLRFVCIIKSGTYTPRDLITIFKKGLNIVRINLRRLIYKK